MNEGNFDKEFIELKSMEKENFKNGLLSCILEFQTEQTSIRVYEKGRKGNDEGEK